VLDEVGVPTVRYGRGEDNELVLSVGDLGPEGASGLVRDASGREAPVRLRVDGEHNLLNAVGAIAAAGLVGVSLDDAASAVAAYAGVHRRFERRGIARGAEFFDDYGAAQDPIPGVTGRLVAEGVELAAPSPPVVYLPHRTEIIDYLDREVRPGDLVVTMGCGDVWMVADAALERLGGDARE
jgi:UDP-N-acetylmuramate-alanine ligase